MTGTLAACCAPAANGHVAALPTRVKNSRRLIGPSNPKTDHRTGSSYDVAMSALGQKLTCATHKPMSAKCQ